MNQFQQAKRFGVKFYAQNDLVDLHPAIEIFHRWIQSKAITDDLMIDVADYRHVPHGPGVMLICNNGHYALGYQNGALGLSYHGKRNEDEQFEKRLISPLIKLLQAAQMLEQEKSLKITFQSNQILFKIQDRLFAPNTTQSYEAFVPELEKLFSKINLNSKIELSHPFKDPREDFNVCVNFVDQNGLDLKMLFERVVAIHPV